MQSHSRAAGHRLAKGATACQRCRRRKQKCDLKYPNCSNCEGANVACLTYHSGKQAEIPRNYVANLESQLERLTRQNEDLQRELQRQRQSPSVNPESIASFESSSSVVRELSSTPTIEFPSTFDRSTGRLQDLVKSVRTVVAEPSEQPRFLGPSSGITLAKMVIASIRSDSLPSFVPPSAKHRPTTSSTSNNATTLPAPESSLPPRHAADHLIDVYFQYRTPHLPIVERSQVEPAVGSAYSFLSGHQSPGRVIERDVFMTYMIFAIALCNVPNPSGGTVRVLQSEGCFRSATAWIEKVITYSKSDIETLRLVLLLAQFVSMCPWQGSLWHLTGIAMRLCTDIGLHWESTSLALTSTPSVLYERRRLWYSAYHLDRVLSITLGRPLSIPDESTRVPLPHPWSLPTTNNSNLTYDMHHQRAHNHLFTLSKLESEIKHVQQSLINSTSTPTSTHTLTPAYPKPNYTLWLASISPRLHEWYHTIPTPTSAHPSSIFAQPAYWDYVYNNTILLLYRPNSSAQGMSMSSEALGISHDAACKLVASIKILQREGRVDVLWKTAYQLFIGGLMVVYCVWQRPNHNRSGETNGKENNVSIPTSISTLQTCAATLAAMAETFSGVSGIRDIFETLSSITVNYLFHSSDDDVVRRNRVEFDKQVEDLLAQFQGTNSTSTATGRGEGCSGVQGPGWAFGGGMGMGMEGESAKGDVASMLATDVFSEMLSSAAQWPDTQAGGFADGLGLGDEVWFP